jgi:hypothetical protein
MRRSRFLTAAAAALLVSAPVPGLSAAVPPIANAEVAIVAEASEDGGGATRPCVLFDRGCTTATAAKPEDLPPASARITRQLVAELRLAGMDPTIPGSGDPVLLISHWGIAHAREPSALNRERFDPNVRMRLGLVATDRVAGETANFFMGRINGLRDVEFGVPGFLSPEVRRIVDLIRADRAFLMVSAYDGAAARHRKAVLLWRVKCSARSDRAPLPELLAALAHAAGPHFGHRLESTLIPTGPLACAPELPADAELTNPAEMERLARGIAQAEVAEFGFD